DEFPVLPIAGNVEFFAVPDAESAAATAFAAAIIVHERAVVLMVMLGAIHRVHDEAAVLFDPHVRAAADSALGLDERLTVGAEGNAVALPCKIVEAFRHETGEGLHDGRWDCRQSHRCL